MIPVRLKTSFFYTFCNLLIIACNPASENIANSNPNFLWNSLHNSKPFQSEFFHGTDFRTPQGACDEANCHGTSLTGGNSGAPSCLSCHDNQWVVFGDTHTKIISGYYHRFNVDEYPADRNTNTGWFNSCKTCHGPTFDGLQGGPSENFAYRYSCKVCHTRFSGTMPPPGHNVNKSDEGKSGWHHYNYQSADPGGTNTNCSGTACHGTNGRSSAAASGLFGRSPACGECH